MAMGEVQGFNEQSFKYGSGKASEEMWVCQGIRSTIFLEMQKNRLRVSLSVNVLLAGQFAVSLCLCQGIQKAGRLVKLSRRSNAANG